MKKWGSVLATILLISACSEPQEQNQTNTETLPTEAVLEQGENISIQPKFDVKFEEIVYSYDAEKLPGKCEKGSDIICAIDLQAKCTINPKLSECDPKKLPKFTFMEDESLRRPTQQTFQVVKIKPIDPYTIEVYTKGTCNGVWFGLCEGNIVYVLNNKSGEWIVKDLYALEHM